MASEVVLVSNGPKRKPFVCVMEGFGAAARRCANSPGAAKPLSLVRLREPDAHAIEPSGTDGAPLKGHWRWLVTQRRCARRARARATVFSRVRAHQDPAPSQPADRADCPSSRGRAQAGLSHGAPVRVMLRCVRWGGRLWRCYANGSCNMWRLGRATPRVVQVRGADAEHRHGRAPNSVRHSLRCDGGAPSPRNS